ncbi:SGNH/GDSL hydrolase family protein [Paenibacillus sp. S150]|uniref:SGNH/GDSL hydrolase family protein n=1 Tax=Paenibacillus sp. S150 TaxID=2749826 RepID=UPI001C5A053F|nr:SGNH/GDSL hydrolase family protein [Paenibacillus sp. S150]MBW4084162.1 SGNH/GDSL hydrolase family protein [Paenibacillus sp. S150]
MAANQTGDQGIQEVGGPEAPKDPVARRSSFFIMFESVIEATARSGGKPSQEIYLDGNQFSDKARWIGGVTDERCLELLKSSTGFRELVHSIGVTVKAHSEDTKAVHFVLQHWGRTDKYETGTLLRVPCPADGSETLITPGEYPRSSDDDVPGKLAIEFEQAGELATASIILYLQEGFRVPEISLEPPVDFESAGYREMIAGSLLSKGNNKRLKTAIEKAKRGEEVTIAYIGGSITQGAGAKPLHTNCYAYKSYLLFKQMFGKEEGSHIHFIKAGVGGTPSELGIIRYERDILRGGDVTPDIVVVEFAVNDAGDETMGNCYESLCLKILTSANKPAVILLFGVFLNDWNLQDRLAPVGWHYDLPMVSVKDAAVGQFHLTKAEGNIISKRQFFYDIYHPANDGHSVMADCLAHLFAETALSALDPEDIAIVGQPVIGNDFKAVRLLDRSSREGAARIDAGGFIGIDSELQMVEMDDHPYGSPEFPDNWMHTASSGSGSFKMAIYSKSLILVYKDSGNPEFGSAEIRVDGQMVKLADPHGNNWTHCNPVLLYQEKDAGEHLVEIKMAAGHESKRFTILGFGYVR